MGDVLAFPSRSGDVVTFLDEVFARAFDGPGADLEVAVDEPLVVHHGQPLGEVGDGLLEPLASALIIARSRSRDAGQRGAQFVEQLGRLATEDLVARPAVPALERAGALAVDAGARLPDVLEAVEDIERVDGMREVALGVDGEVVVAVGDESGLPMTR